MRLFKKKESMEKKEHKSKKHKKILTAEGWKRLMLGKAKNSKS